MGVDFRDAAQRHWEDAEHLSADARLANADHLFGLSAECALKAVMLGLGMKLKADNSPKQMEHRVHIDNLWDEFVTFAKSKNGAKYAARMPGGANPFCDWSIAQRYDHRSCFTASKVAERHRAAKVAMAVLDDAILDGGVV